MKKMLIIVVTIIAFNISSQVVLAQSFTNNVNNLALQKINAYMAARSQAKFDVIDINGDNSIDFHEFISPTSSEYIDLDSDLFNVADSNANHTLDVNEFDVTLYGNIRLAGLQKYINPNSIF